MAKIKKETSDSAKFSKKDLDNIIGGVVGEDWLPPSKFIHTGNYILNAQISGSLFKGYPNNTWTAIGGESSSGKTFVLLNGAKNAIEQHNYYVFYFDTEGGVNKNVLDSFGIDPTMIRIIPANTITEVKKGIVTFIQKYKELKQSSNEIQEYLVILDSVSMLSSQRQIDDALSGSDKKDMGSVNQELWTLFNAITREMATLEIPGLMSLHTYVDYMTYGSPQKIKNGGGPRFASGVMLKFSKVHDRDDDKKKVGIWVTSNLDKTRFTVDHKIRFNISFYKGMNPYIGLEEYIDWETCGIGKGKLIPKTRSVPVIDEKTNQPKMRNGEIRYTEEETGEYEYVPMDKGTDYAVRHLNKTVKLKNLFNAEVFTQEVLEQLDEKIKKEFAFGNAQNLQSSLIDEISDSIDFE